MSDANLTSLFYAAESSFAETPDNLSTLQELRFVSESLIHNKNTVVSEEIRADRARADLIQVGVSAEGTIDAEMIIKAYNDLILAGLLTSAFTQGQDSVTASTVAASQTITATTGTFSAATQAAKFVKIAGFVNSGNNGIFELVSATSTVLTLAAGSLTGADETDVASVTADYNYARNGVTLTSFLIEKRFASLSPDHFVGTLGAVVNELNLTLEAQGIAQISFGFMGARQIEGNATYGDGSPTAVSTNPILNTTANVGTIRWDGATFGSNIMGVTMALNNNLRERPRIGSLYTLEHGKGTIDLTGNINCYFEDPTLLTSFIDHDSADLLLPMIDANGNLMSVHLPQIKFTSGAPPTEGINTDVMMDLEYQALLDPTLDYVIQIDQLDA